MGRTLQNTPGFPYPAPRFPVGSYRQRPRSVEEWLPIARRACGQPGRGRTGALGPIEKGDRILILTDGSQDDTLMAAFQQAMKEHGVKRVDVVYEPFASADRTAPDRRDASEGWREVEFWLKHRFSLEYTRDVQPVRVAELVKEQGYTKVYAGLGGPLWSWARPIQEIAGVPAYKGYWMWRTWEDGIDKGYLFPEDIQERLDNKIVKLLGQASAVRFSDPEGTYLEWAIGEEEATLWSQQVFPPGHVFLYPYQATRDLAVREPKKRVFPSANGVVAGTANHSGYLPRIEILVENGVITDIKGGGRYGDLWRAWFTRLSEVPYPNHPRPGYWYLFEMGLGTNPKSFPRADLFGGLVWLGQERHRAGIVHIGFGTEALDQEFLQFARHTKAPMSHWWHMHAYSPTYAIRLRDSGEWLTLIDRGWITLLDDPEIRTAASKYGDPDDTLSYEWIPALPGVNTPGSYLHDFGSDPAQWVQKHLVRQLFGILS